MMVHFPAHTPRQSPRAVVFCYYRRRDGDIQIVRVVEHSRLGDKISKQLPPTWRGPFATALDAARDADAKEPR